MITLHFQVLIVSKLDYCNSLLYMVFLHILFKTYNKLRTQQLVSVITHSPRFGHITPVLRELHWLPVHLRIEFKVLLITSKALRGQAPTYIQDLLQPYQPARSLRSSSQNVLVKPRFNSYGKWAFSVAAPSLWNSLPQDIISSCTVDIFKRRLKTLLFTRAFDFF